MFDRAEAACRTESMRAHIAAGIDEKNYIYSCMVAAGWRFTSFESFYLPQFQIPPSVEERKP